MVDQKRPYRMKRRAELEARTRLRITESAVELHRTLGPARTSISAIAEHAGVRRSTVYRHFPDEAALFAACSSHWRAAHPPPDLEAWSAVRDPAERLGLALRQLYTHYRETEAMRENVLRDEPAVPIITELLSGYRAYLGTAVDLLVRGRRLPGSTATRVRAAVGHALAFTTWQSLTRDQGLTDGQAGELMCRFVATAAEGLLLSSHCLTEAAESAHRADHRGAGDDQHAGDDEAAPDQLCMAAPEQTREQHRPERLRRVQRRDDRDASAVERLEQAGVGDSERGSGGRERAERGAELAADPIAAKDEDVHDHERGRCAE